MLTATESAPVLAESACAAGPSASALELDWSPIATSNLCPLEEIWTDLERRAEGSFFTSWLWIRSWLEGLSPECSPHLLKVSQASRVVGLAIFGVWNSRRFGLLPVRRCLLQESGERFFDDTLTIEHNGFLIDREFTETVSPAMINFLMRSRSIPWDELHLSGIAERSPIWSVLESLPAGLILEDHKSPACCMVDLNQLRDSSSDYLSTLSSTTRSQIRKAMRLYEQRGPLRIVTPESLTEKLAWFEDFRQLHQRLWKSRGEPGAFPTQRILEFHDGLLTYDAVQSDDVSQGYVDLLRVLNGDRTLGYLYLFRYRGQVSNYQTAFEYEEDPRLKPGLVCHTLAIEWYLNRGANTYDFLAGEARYKRSLADEKLRLRWAVIHRKTWSWRLENWLRMMKRKFFQRVRSPRETVNSGTP